MNSAPSSFLPSEVSREQHERNKKLTYCCHSLSNLALIVACIVAIVLLANFFQDEPLYEYGEHLLTLKFYRQLVYTITILPLVLLIPLFNATSTLFLSGQQKLELGRAILIVKLVYQVIMAILVFLGLIFVAPNMRYSSLVEQLDYEFRRHMKRRFENAFSYDFIERIQETYRCCDESWYRANYYYDKLPLSCIRPDGQYTDVFEQTCSQVIGLTVSNRCIVISGSLVAIIVALVALIGIDLVDFMTLPRSQQGAFKSKGESSSPKSVATNPGGQQESVDESSLEDQLVDEISNRLKLHEREREDPLLPKKSDGPIRELSRERKRELDEGNAYNSEQMTPVLTRAHYVHNRPHSPLLAGGSSRNLNEQALLDLRPPTKGVLKNSSTSIQRIDSDEEDINDYHKQLHRDLQTRRSLLSVRFAE